MRIKLLLFFVILFEILGNNTFVFGQNNASTALDKWSLFDPSDPQLPTLINKNSGTYQLDDTWKVQSIEYLYQWWGLGKPVFDYQILAKSGEKFVKDKAEVNAADVQKFIQSIIDLHPTQFLLAGSSHTDDYPSWNVQITGEDGNIILLFASSNGNPGGAPWNILYNGKMYAQYTGALAEPLSKLFSGERGQPAAAFFPGGEKPGMISFTTNGFPRQLTEGFAGLLPIADGFQYKVDAEKQAINGIIKGRESIGGFGNMVIGAVTQLDDVSLTLADKSIVKCDIKTLKSDDPAGAAWSFACEVPSQIKDQPYRIPISVAFATDANENFTIKGELYGKWGNQPDVILVPNDEQIENLLQGNNNAKELLSNHVLAFATYEAQLNPNNINEGTVSGEAVFVGQTEVSQKSVRYTIATPFTIENGKLTKWDLNKNALESLLARVMQSPITQKAIQDDPNLIVNLTYSLPNAQPQANNAPQSSKQNTPAPTGSCGSQPNLDFTDPTKPYETFSLNSGWTTYRSDFVLVDDAVIVNDVDLFPLYNNRGDVFATLLPDVFKTTSRSFERVRMQSQGNFGAGPTLTLWIPRDATPTEMKDYQKIAQAIGGTLNKEYEPLWTITDVRFVVSDAGKIEIINCKG